jgi:outer membrane lipoprotein-sorting protein
MRKLQAVSMMVLPLVAGLTGCFSTTRVVQKTQAPDVYRTTGVEQLEKEISDRDAAIQTLNAQVLITASTGGAKEGKVIEYTSFRGYIFVRRPRDLRVILQLPVIGSRAMDMVSDGKKFTLLIPPKDKAIVGTNEVTKPSDNGLYNLRPAVFLDSLLVPAVRPEEYVALTESTRVIQPESRHHAAIEEPDYDVSVLKVKSGNVMQRERTIHISRVSMLPFQQDVYDDNGQIVTQAMYDDYQLKDGQQFPMLVTIRRPLDEYTLKIEVTKLSLNEKLEDDQFELKIPPGITVQKME